MLEYLVQQLPINMAVAIDEMDGSEEEVAHEEDEGVPVEMTEGVANEMHRTIAGQPQEEMNNTKKRPRQENRTGCVIVVSRYFCKNTTERATC